MNLKTQSEVISKILKTIRFIRPSATIGDNTSNIEKLKMYYETFDAFLIQYAKERESRILIPVKY